MLTFKFLKLYHLKPLQPSLINNLGYNQKLTFIKLDLISINALVWLNISAEDQPALDKQCKFVWSNLDRNHLHIQLKMSSPRISDYSRNVT